MFPNSRKKKTDTSAYRRGVFFCVLHTCPSQPATRSSFRRFHLRPHHSSWNREPCGYARFRGFRRPSFDASSTPLSFRTLLSHFSDAPHARRCIASCALPSFFPDGRKRCPAHTGRRWHASRSIHDGGVRGVLQGLTGCGLFQERSGGTMGLSFVSGGSALVWCMRLCSVSEAWWEHRGSFLCIRESRGSRFWKRPGSTAGLSFVSCDISTRSGSVVEASGRRADVQCFRSVQEAPRIFPLYQ